MVVSGSLPGISCPGGDLSDISGGIGGRGILDHKSQYRIGDWG